MSVKDLVIGVLVAATVLVVVAVPIFGGFAPTESRTIYTDGIDGQTATFYYRQYDPDGYPRFDTMTITASTVTITWLIDDESSESVAYGVNEVKNGLIGWGNRTNMLQDIEVVTGVYMGANSSSITLSTIQYNPTASSGSTNQVINPTNKTFVIDRYEGYETMRLKNIDDDSEVLPMGIGPYVICPRSIADTVISDRILTDGEAFVLAQFPTSSTIGTYTNPTTYYIGSKQTASDEGAVELTTDNTYLLYPGATLDSINGRVTFDKTDLGYIVDIDTISTTVTKGNATSTVENNGLWLIGPLSYTIEGSVGGLEYSLAAFVPVLLGLVLVASVAANFYRRNME